MTVESFAASTVKFVLDDITNITFSGEVSAIGSTVANGSTVNVTASGDEIIVNGLKAGAKVSVYDAGGSLMATTYSDADGRATVNVAGLGKGVFVVNTPDSSFKFIK